MEKDKFEIANMIAEMADWIVGYMDLKELTSLAYDTVYENIKELPDNEIRAQYESMFNKGE